MDFREGGERDTKKEVVCEEKSEQKGRPSKFCANDWRLVVAHHLLQIPGYAVNPVFNRRVEEINNI